MKKLKTILGLGVISLAIISCAAEPVGAEPVGAEPVERELGRRGQQAFENLDNNGDGGVDFAEFQANSPNFIARLDTDGDEAVSLNEFMSMQPARPRRGGRANQESNPRGEEVTQRQARMQERVRERFSAMDTDGDSLVTVAEMQQAQFQRLDRDSDGVLDKAELRPRGERGRGRNGPGRRNRTEREVN